MFASGVIAGRAWAKLEKLDVVVEGRVAYMCNICGFKVVFVKGRVSYYYTEIEFRPSAGYFRER